MSSRRYQVDGGCVTVEYSTEEKRELYSAGEEWAEEVGIQPSYGLRRFLRQKLLK